MKGYRGLPRSFALLLPFFFAWTGTAWADAYCTETITSVVMHSNGNIYFTSSATCSTGWCEVTYASQDANNKAYALLLSALTTGKPVQFDWPAITGSSQQNALYASPGWMSMGQ